MGSCAHPSAYEDRWCGGRGPVFLMTGLLADSASLVLDFPGQSLGVFVSSYLTLSLISEIRAFSRSEQIRPCITWRRSMFHEHALYDLPAQIDYVLSETGQKQLLYIGISQGTLSFFAMMSERPEYNDKVKAFAGLAPFNKLAHIKVPPLAIFGPYAETALFAEQGDRSGSPPPCFALIFEFTQRLAQAVGGSEVLPKDFQLMSITRIPVYLCHNPAGTSMKNIIHYGQLVGSKRAQKFDYGASKNSEVYGQREPPEYNLSRVTTDVGLFWSKGDEFVTPREVDELRSSLRGRIKRERYIADPFYTHVHFVIGLVNQKYLFSNLLDFLAGYPAQQNSREDVDTTTDAVYTTIDS
ncbi:hypothetical protein HPB50_024425 [Hyalomma asiaticum]|uniref:Uncharacterized protein n=1 Tax=Hyalomma asiaticum TaxID=266040 RepID=A0ACB7S638_HYAAI|nr:hypothetical protein HPB50_024425 [Hyalomma asiaticum]